MKNLLICVSGSIAAKLLYKIYNTFYNEYNIQIILTKNAEYFIWNTNNKNSHLNNHIVNLFSDNVDYLDLKKNFLF